MPLIARAFAMLEGGGLTRFLAAMGPTAIALGLQFATFAITARGLGVEAFGQYAIVLALAAIGVELVGLGGGDLLVRAVAREAGRFPAYFGNMLLLIAATLVPVVLGAGWLAMGQGAGGLGIGLVLLALAAEILVGRVSSSVEMAMVAHGHVFRASCVRMATAGTRLIAAIFYFAVLRELDGWILAVAAQSALLSIVLLALATLLYGRPHFRLQTADLPAGLAFGINQAARSVQGNIDRVVLGHFAGDAVLGVYSAGSRLLAIGIFPIQVMTRILYPDFFRHGEQGLGATRRYAISKLPVMLATGCAAAAAVSAVAGIAPVVLGPDFAGSREVAMWLSLSLPLIALQYLAADTLTGSGYQHIRALVYTLAAIGFGLLLVAGARVGGVEGLIAGYLLAHAALAAILWALSWLLERRGPRSSPARGGGSPQG